MHKLNIKRDLIKIKKNYSFYSNQQISKIKLYPKIITVLKRLKKKYLISIITSKNLNLFCYRSINSMMSNFKRDIHYKIIAIKLLGIVSIYIIIDKKKF